MFVTLLLVAACGETAPSGIGGRAADIRGTVAAESLAACEPRSMIELEVVATGLDVPWDLAFLSDGSVLVTERVGRIRRIAGDGLEAVPWAVIPVEAMGEAGLLGIDVARDTAGSDMVFVAGTFRDDRRAGVLRRLLRRGLRSFTAEDGYPVHLRVLAFAADTEEPVARVVVAGVPAGQLHVGGALRIGPDGALWLGTGDAAEPDLAQRSDTRAGKVLRYSRDGGIPRDNPDRGSPVYATGIRNVQGIAWSAEGGAPWGIDHGPSGLAAEGRRRGSDELNRLLPGGNYGWPAQAGDTPTDTAFIPPAITWRTAIAPAGLAAAGPGPWEGDLLVAGLRGHDVFRVAMYDGEPVCIEPLLDGRFGRMRAVRAGPGDWIYVTTSNRDGRGTPGEDDDYLLRLRPLRPAAPRPPG